MKVLHLLKTSVGATWALRQMRELVRAGVEVHAAMPAGGPLVAEYERAGVVVHPHQFGLPVARPWEWPRLFERLRGLVGDIAPALIHSHFVGTTLTMRLALGRSHAIPRIFQVPGPLHLEHRFFRSLDIRTAGGLDVWIGSCAWTCRAYHAAGIPVERIGLSYYGADLEHISRRPVGRLRAELGLGPDVRIVGMVAYFYAPKRYLGQQRGLKGHEDFIDAMVLLQRERSDLLGVVVGGAWNGATTYEAQVRAYAAELCGERVVFLGTRSDVPDLYSDMDVVVHPSHSENVGGAAESLLLEVPTIATDVGGFPDLVKPGRTGWLVPPRDPPAIATALNDALADPERARSMAREGRFLASELFDVRGTARVMHGLYDSLLRYGHLGAIQGGFQANEQGSLSLQRGWRNGAEAHR